MLLGYMIIYLVFISSRAQYLEKPQESKYRSKRSLNFNIICPPGCVTCSPVSGCVTCMDGLYLILHRSGLRQTGMCVPSCPTGYYGLNHKNYNKCYKCNLDNCLSCVSSTYCIACNPPHIAYKGHCIGECPPGLFYETYTRSCLPKADCSVGEWADWEACTKNGQHCGYKYGIQQRARSTVQQPSQNGLACPALKEYRQCKLTYRFCSDLENNYSDISPVYNYNTVNKRHRNDNRTKNRNSLKQKKQERRRRKRCKSKGRKWRRGICIKRRNHRKRKEINNAIVPDLSSSSIDYAIIKNGRKLPLSYQEWLNTIENNVIV